jgi:hypothetical protein
MSTKILKNTVLAILALAVLGLSANQASANCQFANGIQHVVLIQFDNVHFERDNPNVPSDLEQMPTLLNFLKNQGTFLTNHHTPLISHTADDIITTMTGIYGDRHGQPVSNSYGYFKTNGTIGFTSSFAYWTDTNTSESTPAPIMYGPNGITPPAPWVPYTKAGCDVGGVSIANIDLENVTTDVTNVFGTGSPEALEAAANSAQAVADFEGVIVHCGYNSATCNNTYAKIDKLRSEVGGYAGYKGLFGHKYVKQAISPNGPLLDLDGNVINGINGTPGFPGFNPLATQTLGYIATMLESGIPVVYSYISDAHDNHGPGGIAYGPGEAGYVAQLKSYDAAFAKFFTRLNNDGINSSNTLFVILPDEQDHFAGTQNPTPTGCDGVNVPCTYVHTPAVSTATSAANIGEININLSRVLATEKGNTTPFSVHSDLSPTFYLNGNPAQTASVTRQLERDVASLTAFNAFTALTEAPVDYLADHAGMSMLHMITADTQRNPTFVAFQKGDFYGYTSGTSACTQINFADCVQVEPAFAWNHGGYQPEITTIWMGIVGPGVNAGVTDSTTWSDHTDVRPTIMHLLGLVDDYQHDGRTLVEVLKGNVVPASVGTVGSASYNAYVSLAQAYKQINAPVGSLGIATLQASTIALTGNDAGDLTYTTCTAKINSWVETRNTLAKQMINLLEGAVFNGAPVDPTTANGLISQANSLIANASGGC